MINSLLVATLLQAAPVAPVPEPVDLSALGPSSRKARHEKDDRQGIDALFKALDAAMEKGDLAAYTAVMDFPVTVVTDGADGATLAQSMEREAFEKAVAGSLKPPSHLKIASKRTVVLLSDALANVVDETTMTLGKVKSVSRSAAVVVHRDGGWKLKVLTEPGWAALLAPHAAAAP